MILPGSYANGFAPRDGQPLYPELWRGCVGAWAPCLGPTGLTLRDWSGYRRNGLFSAMTASGAWVIADRPSLFVSNLSSERIAVDSTGWSTAQGSVCGWIRKTVASASNNDYVIWSKVTSSSDRFLFEIETFSNDSVGTNLQVTGGFGTNADINNIALNPTATTLNAWLHVGLTWSAGSPLRLWVNGRNTASTVNNYAAQSQTAIEYFGNYSSGSFSFGGNLDDMRRYDTALTASEFRLLATRRGIAYEMAPRRRSSSAVQFNRRRRLLVGAGS